MSANATEAMPSASRPATFTLVLPGRVCPIGAGWTWIAQGWRLFARTPLMWIVALLLLVIIAFALMLVPFLGHIALQLLGPVFAGGLVLACAATETQGEFELGELFGGFRTNFGSLVALGAIFLLAQLAIVVVCLGIVGFGTMAGIFGTLVSGDAQAAAHAVLAAGMSIALASLVGLALFVPLLAAIWFAPALVVMHGMAPLKAMGASFSGCVRNILPFLWYGIVMFVLSIVAAIPIFLGYLVLLPLTFTSTYAAYRDIYTGGIAEPARSGAAAG